MIRFPHRPYTPYGGQLTHVWFDKIVVHIDSPEQTESEESACRDVDNLIEMQGIPRNKIILGKDRIIRFPH